MFWNNARLLVAATVILFAFGMTACKKKAMEDEAPKAAMMDEDTKKGKELFEAATKGNCASCHGMEGKGDTPVGQSLKARNLQDTASYKQGATADAIAETIKSGVKTGPSMPPRPDIAEADRKLIAKYVVSLQK